MSDINNTYHVRTKISPMRAIYSFRDNDFSWQSFPQFPGFLKRRVATRFVPK